MDFLGPLVASHNSSPAFDTSFSRDEVKDSNFFDYLDERFSPILGEPESKFDITTTFNSASIDSRSLPPDSARRVLTFLPGDSVLVSRKSLKVDEEGKPRAFVKPSVIGNFSRQTYTVVSSKLRPTAKGELVPGQSI